MTSDPCLPCSTQISHASVSPAVRQVTLPDCLLGQTPYPSSCKRRFSLCQHYFNILKFLRVFSLRTSLCPAASLCFPQRPPCSVTHGALRLCTRVTKYQVDMSNMPESKAGAGALYIGSTVVHGKKAWGGEKTLQQERFLRWRESKRAGWRMREENALRRWHQPS